MPVAYPTVTLEMTKGVDFSAVHRRAGERRWHGATAWRRPTDVHAPFIGTDGVRSAERAARRPATDAAAGLRDYYDFATYNQSTQGHLNADGLCCVVPHTTPRRGEPQ